MSSTDANMVYLTIYNAHNGASARVPKPVRFYNMSQLKNYILEVFTEYIIGNVDNIFLLTSFGMKVNFNMINELNDIYVFDKRLFGSSEGTELVSAYLNQNPGHFKDIRKPSPSSLREVDSGSIKKMTGALRVNEGWSKALSQDCLIIDEQNRQFGRQISTIFKAFNIVFQYASNFVNDIEKSSNSYTSYIKLLSLKSLHKEWTVNYNNLKAIPSFRFHNGQSVKLVDLLAHDRLEKKAAFISQNLPKVVNDCEELTAKIKSNEKDKDDIDRFIEGLRNESMSLFKSYDPESKKLIGNVTKSSQMISSDIEKLTENGSISLDWVFRTHKNELSTRIFESSSIIYEYLLQFHEFKTKLSNHSLHIFKIIANSQMRMVEIRNELKLLTNPLFKREDNAERVVTYELINEIKLAEDYLSLTIDLPLLFGFLMVEKRRQFEWHDFYSKGIVNNVSEQLATIIDHEKLFRRIWLKKFGTFLDLLNNGSSVNSKGLVPTIDVTLSNGDSKAAISFSVLNKIDIDRIDITNFIKVIQDHAPRSPPMSRFSEILEQNYRDLIRCTNNLKKVTKIIASISAFTSLALEGKSKKSLTIEPQLEKSESHEGIRLEDIDLDMNLVKGLKLRIKKLENLLHQQQYRDLLTWPVTRTDNQSISFPSLSKRDNIAASQGKEQATNQSHFAGSSNSQNKVITSPMGRNGNGFSENRETSLEASNIIDRHLEISRLKSENQALKEKLEILQSKTANQDEVTLLKRENEGLKLAEKESDEEHIAEMQRKDDEVRELKDIHNKEKASLITEKDSIIDQKDKLISELRNQLSAGEKNKHKEDSARGIINKLKIELDDANNIKNDLLSNMSSKENENNNERVALEEQLKSLRFRLEEKTEDYENLMELTQNEHKSVEEFIRKITRVVSDLFLHIKWISESQYDNFIEFCLILESMGLLLMQEDYDGVKKFKISRVKGLKTKKGDKGPFMGNDIIEDTNYEKEDFKPTSKVIGHVTEIMDWIHELDSAQDSSPISFGNETDRSEPELQKYATSDSTDKRAEDSFNLSADGFYRFDSQTNKLLKIYDTVFQKQDDDDLSKFDRYLKTLEFKDNVYIQSNENTAFASRFFLSAISKRFSDVERFAKKLTKENKSKRNEIKSLTSKLESRISVYNFQVGDLVMFLPTKVEDSSSSTLKESPWAAFNIGSPHYFLKNPGNALNLSNSREWFVGKVLHIEEHLVSAESVNDPKENPFRISEGIRWYSLEAEEVTM
ncbi:Piso0_004954 [Millerozyma farinosa CBS 7064]|uniref:Autophagy-related protein 11 n=1 Tax=Pichia sorbitophila (strain ATCC MYA-4447 / BCRC 22081 / CBS 7064 / NBRC 10061 / NRRL Y-12695) TaxID=559304 RepID=G8Y3U6_PICSO|nr:Piso0_004954 [Millerozyma farinosa CBS 7064]